MKDYGNIEYKSKDLHGRLADNMKDLRDFAECTKELSNQVQNIIKDNRICITLGGDHSIAVGKLNFFLNIFCIHLTVCAKDRRYKRLT